MYNHPVLTNHSHTVNESASSSQAASQAASVDQIVAELSPIISGQRRSWAMRCQARGVSMMHFQLISLLNGEGPLPMSRLAELLDITYPNASGLVSRLEERGLVEREHAVDDRRVVLARATDAARSLLDDLETDRLARLTNLIDAMTAEEREIVHRSVTAFRAATERLTDTQSAHSLEHPHDR
jgi:DNA-binding MarR family transcriptional regulator